MTDELKTLNDFEEYSFPEFVGKETKQKFIDIKELKSEAVKWVKSDIERIKRTHPENFQVFSMIMIRRWMIRFNLTEDDLK
jgi:hypothetical protein